MNLCCILLSVDSSVGRASDCRSDGPWFDSGSTDFSLHYTAEKRIVLVRVHMYSRSYSVVVITVDFDSTDTGSNPVRTFFQRNTKA